MQCDNGKQITKPKSYKSEFRILANPGLALSGFEQPGPAPLNSHYIALSQGHNSKTASWLNLKHIYF